MLHAHSTSAIAAVQYLPPSEQAKVVAMLERKASRNQRARFARCFDAAKAKAEADERERDEWLVQQYEAMQSEEDLAW